MNHLLALFGILIATTFATAEPSYDRYAALLERYAMVDGVDYDAWAGHSADVSELAVVLAEWAVVEVSALTSAAQQAFYLNLYNAAMLQAVLAHYPIRSVTDLAPDFGVFKERFIQQGGRQLSLDEVEKGILLEQWDEPRHHFAVNCASTSCPPLRAEPYQAHRLEAQLEEQTRDFLNSAEGVVLDLQRRELRVSKLFEWYADDFPQPLSEYLAPYLRAAVPRGWAIGYLEYDWSLNEAR